MIECICGCGELIPEINKKGKPARFKHGHNHKGKYGPDNHGWKGGGIHIDKKGYIRLSRGLKMHRVIYEQWYDCCLLPWIDIHHIDGNKQNNRIENLQPMKHSDHGKLHNPIHQEVMLQN
jgi:HNH endonuclease